MFVETRKHELEHVTGKRGVMVYILAIIMQSFQMDGLRNMIGRLCSWKQKRDLHFDASSFLFL